MVRKKRKRIILGQTADNEAVSSCEEKIADEQKTGSTEYELRRSLEMCIKQAEIMLNRMKAEDERQADKC